MTSPFRVVALIAAYNEGDIISQVIGHLSANGVETYLLDHHSTDDTVERAREWLGQGLIGIETFPEDAGVPSDLSGVFAWTEILRRKEVLATELGANWYIHHDADEIRESPFPGLTLAEGLRWVDSVGYNCVNFELYNFCPTNEDWQPGLSDPKVHFEYFDRPAEFDEKQRKCWRATSVPVDLTTDAGHDVKFAGRRVFPIRFLLRHYRIRSSAHGRRKIQAERIARFDPAERARGWHVQYDEMAEQTTFVRDPSTLLRFDVDAERSRLLIENEVTLELRARLSRLEPPSEPAAPPRTTTEIAVPSAQRPLAEIISELRANGLDTDKVNSYLENYAEFLGGLRDAPIRMLELGVLGGGSIAMWHAYFSRATIVGLDERAATSPAFESYFERERLGARVSLVLGTRIPEHTLAYAERAALFHRSLADQRFDVILDDAAHTYTTAKAAFEVLFDEYLKPGGIYILEDWGTTYFPEWPDGSVSGETGMLRLIKEACDEVALADRIRDAPDAERRSKIHSVDIRFGQAWIFKSESPE